VSGHPERTRGLREGHEVMRSEGHKVMRPRVRRLRMLRTMIWGVGRLSRSVSQQLFISE